MANSGGYYTEECQYGQLKSRQFTGVPFERPFLRWNDNSHRLYGIWNVLVAFQYD